MFSKFVMVVAMVLCSVSFVSAGEQVLEWQGDKLVWVDAEKKAEAEMVQKYSKPGEKHLEWAGDKLVWVKGCSLEEAKGCAKIEVFSKVIKEARIASYKAIMNPGSKEARADADAAINEAARAMAAIDDPIRIVKVGGSLFHSGRIVDARTLGACCSGCGSSSSGGASSGSGGGGRATGSIGNGSLGGISADCASSSAGGQVLAWQGDKLVWVEAEMAQKDSNRSEQHLEWVGDKLVWVKSTVGSKKCK